jgi:type III restriction enzyme
MTTFAPKTYQQQVLDSVEAYFKACHELPSPSTAFTATTERLWGRGNRHAFASVRSIQQFRRSTARYAPT